MKKLALLIGILVSGHILIAQSPDPIRELRKYNVTWESPSLNSLGSMPVGNGDIGMNVWVEENGDLQFYLSKTDAWSENCQLLKLGKIRVHLTPNPFVSGAPFRQELDLAGGEIRISSGKPDKQTNISIRVDANHPVAEITVHSAQPVEAEVTLETWRTSPRMMDNPKEWPAVYGLQGTSEKPIIIEPDSILSGYPNRLVWFHQNKRSIWADNLRLQSLGDLAGKLEDPLLHRMTGAVVEGSGFESVSALKLRTKRGSRDFTVSIYPLTTLNQSPSAWIQAVNNQITQIKALKTGIRINSHRKWWSDFWNRSYIFISSKNPEQSRDAEIVTRGYLLQRYINACAGRGATPIKFNGSIFTVDTYNRSQLNGFDADFRLWGGPFWFQNTRLPYWSMLESGDHEMMRPLFNMYFDALPLRQAATKKYYNHEGAYFPETMYFWGNYTDLNFGMDRKGKPDGLVENTYLRYYWTGGLEISQMMIDYYQFTGSASFARDTLIPFVTEILAFFDQHWTRDMKGKILFTPAQALETYQTAVDPTPDIAGLLFITRQMIAFPDSLVGAELHSNWIQLAASVPDIPVGGSGEDQVIEPARHYARLSNIENPELYAIFPFRIYGLGKPDLDLAIRTFGKRKHTMNIGWQHSSIQAAYLGLAEEAKTLVIDKFSHSDKECRFPAFWGPNYDWSPDQDHGTVGMIALQRMLLQYEDNQITTFPAWPKEWDVEFRLWAPGKTIVEGSFRDGQVIRTEKKVAR